MKSQTSPLTNALGGAKRALVGIAALSACINVLVLGGSIYMMLVYDRVLPSQSLQTLAGLLVLMLAVYAFQAAFETLRSNMLGDVASDLGESLRPQVSHLAHRMSLTRPREAAANNPLRDLDQIQGFIAGPGPSALIDLPWIVFFLFVLSLLHIWLGITAFVGALLLVGMTWLTDKVNRHAVRELTAQGLRRNRIQEHHRVHAEVIAALGMRDRLMNAAFRIASEFSSSQRELNEINTRYAIITRTLRMVLQSIILTVGALLVLSGEATGGVIFASSILSGRALAPVDQAIGQWRGFVGARDSWARLDKLLAEQETDTARVRLPAPSRELRLEDVTGGPPDIERETVSEVSFALKAGAVLGIIGASASGKSSLVRTIVGAWPVRSGKVRLDGGATDQWDADELGRHVGYLPQSVELFGGSVAFNIGRCDPDVSSEAIIAAAQLAGVHELILGLPGGYQFNVGEGGMNLSAGQRQRVGLARALFGNPFLVVLDEPNSNLDGAGEVALTESIGRLQALGSIVLIVAHRRQVIDCTTDLLVMENGRLRDFGPRDAVIQRLSAANANAGNGANSQQSEAKGPVNARA